MLHRTSFLSFTRAAVAGYRAFGVPEDLLLPVILNRASSSLQIVDRLSCSERLSVLFFLYLFIDALLVVFQFVLEFVDEFLEDIEVFQAQVDLLFCRIGCDLSQSLPSSGLLVTVSVVFGSPMNFWRSPVERHGAEDGRSDGCLRVGAMIASGGAMARSGAPVGGYGRPVGALTVVVIFFVTRGRREWYPFE